MVRSPASRAVKFERPIKMGKIVKYCSSCDEGFAEKFGFCPDCGGQLQAFEMNPLESDVPVAEPEPSAPEFLAAGSTFEEKPVLDDADDGLIVPRKRAAEVAPERVADVEPNVIEAKNADVVEGSDEEANFETDEPVSSSPFHIFSYSEKVDDRAFQDYYHHAHESYDDGYHVTVIQEKGAKERNTLLLGTLATMLFVCVGAWTFSLFNIDLGVGAIGDNRSIALLLDDVPMVVDEELEQKKDKQGGGGGGGGREEPDPVTQGDLANQTPNPVRPPDAKTYRSDNFELQMPVASTKGNMQFEQKYGRYGDPNAMAGLASNGPGSGGGLGSGTGTGQGSGTGSGAGSGTGSGYGGGRGDGNGDGDGPGGGGPPPAVARVTTPYRIISTPKAMYTDEARTKGIQGSVILKITLLANGSIGNITPVKTLGYGLTEKAIAAARQIRFEPKKVNGVAQSVIITRDYSFSIY